MTGFNIVVVLTVIISALAVGLHACLSSRKRCKKENAVLRNEIRDAMVILERLRGNFEKSKSLEEAANAERKALNNADDKNLVHRANGLFGGVRGKPGNAGT